jgi:uncharacterized protein (TIGR00156 family)
MAAKHLSTALFALLMLSGVAHAQFTGPSAERAVLTVAEAHEARPGTYATLTGRLINRLREDYYTFRDDSGEIRVEIPASVWKGRAVNPDTEVRLHVEVDSNLIGRRYLWVEALDVIGAR